MRRITILLFTHLFFLSPLSLPARNRWEAEAQDNAKWYDGIEYNLQMQASYSRGKTPLWLNANKHGLSSLEKTNGYLRASLIRPLGNDSTKKLGLGYGLDAAVPYHHTSRLIVQQAFIEGRWLYGTLSVGSKEYPMELKNNRLSTGSQLLGINARPIPQVRLALPQYWAIPFTNNWLSVKGHVAYGKMTDDNWQHEFTGQKRSYADNVLYHGKAGYLMIGRPDAFVPWSLEMGLEMASTFGGTSYRYYNNPEPEIWHNDSGIKAFVNAFLPGGSDVAEEGTVYQNVEGNQLGSWVMRYNYDFDTWKIGLYAEKFFEDHSSMLMLDYDGYGHGEEWNTRKERKYMLYDLKDWLLGFELNMMYSNWIKNIVFEYLYTKYQSGPVYHDHTQNISDHIGGKDNFYNHYIFTGWQHWGQVIGNPLYLSPLYNEDGRIEVKNNRFVAYHLGFSGNPYEDVSYRSLITYQKGFGTYDNPYTKPHHNISFLLEVNFQLPRQWTLSGACGMDMGGILGHNYGLQLTISKRGLLTK